MVRSEPTNTIIEGIERHIAKRRFERFRTNTITGLIYIGGMVVMIDGILRSLRHNPLTSFWDLGFLVFFILYLGVLTYDLVKLIKFCWKDRE
jgi:hypothetical protein